MEKYSSFDILNKLKLLPGWAYADNSIVKRFTFNSFGEAVGFMVQVALLSESSNHHPNWSGVYNIIELKLFTHDVNSVTSKDFNLAHKIEMIHSKEH